MTNWTSIGVTEGQKEIIESHKPEDRSMGTWLVEVVESHDTGGNGVDSEEVAREVVDRLEGSKPLAEMEFEDWFEPDYAKTIASHIESEIMLSDVGVDYSPVLNRIDDLESQLPAKVKEELHNA